jgi:hypothetical protein
VTNDNNNRISLATSQRSAAGILEQRVPHHKSNFIKKLAATIIVRGGGYTEDDV